MGFLDVEKCCVRIRFCALDDLSLHVHRTTGDVFSRQP